MYDQLNDTVGLHYWPSVDDRGAGDHEGQGGAASYLRAISGVVAGGIPFPPKFWAIGKSSFCQKFFVEKCKL